LLATHRRAAAAEGITLFVAITQPGNHRMIGVFRDSGFPVEVRARPGELHIRFPTSLTPEGRRRFEARERDAAVAAIAHVLRPASVLLAAAGPDSGTAGGEALRNLAGAGFTGTLHAVLAAGEAPAGVTTARTIADVRGDVELAVLALSPYEVLRANRASAARGDVRALVVLLEDSGPVDTDELVASCRAEGMRLVGPHCLGVFNSDPASRSTPRSRRCGPRRVASRSPPRAVHPGIAALPSPRSTSLACRRSSPWSAKADLSGNDLAPGPGGRRRHRRGDALPRVVRQCAPLRTGRPARDGWEAGGRGQDRPRVGGPAAGLVADQQAEPCADAAALRDAVLCVGALAVDHPELAELDCDPLIAGPGERSWSTLARGWSRRSRSGPTRRSGADR
jgi:hypothetical protein